MGTDWRLCQEPRASINGGELAAEDISVTRYGHRKIVQELACKPRETAWKYTGRILRHTGAEVGFYLHQGSTVRVYRGEVPELLLKASLRRQNQQWYSTLPKNVIASTQSGNPFPVPQFSLYPHLISSPRQPQVSG